MKLFYTDALKSAWMAREFGVKFNGSDSLHSDLEWRANSGWWSLQSSEDYRDQKYDCGGEKFLVHKDSEHIFKPQEWDIGRDKINGALCMHKWVGSFHLWTSYDPSEGITDDIEIILRNNTAFHAPMR